MATNRDSNEDIKKASYDDLDAIEDFVRLSNAEFSSESTISGENSTKQESCHGSSIKKGSPLHVLADIETCPPSTSTEECIIVPIDGYLIDDECTGDLNNPSACTNAKDTVLGRSNAGKNSPNDSRRQSGVSVQDESVKPDVPKPSTKKHLDGAQDASVHNSIAGNSLRKHPCSTNHGLGETPASDSSDSSIVGNASSSSSNTYRNQHESSSQDRTLSKSNCLVYFPEKHPPKVMVGQTYSPEESGNLEAQDDGKGHPFNRHIVRYNSQALSSKRSAFSKTASRIHEMGNVEIQSLKRFPGFKGSGKIARIPKAVDVLYVVKDTPDLSGASRGYSRATSPLTDALEMIREEQIKAKDSQAVNRFFIGSVLSSLNINDTSEPSDYRSRNLYDMVEKKSSWGKMTSNYVKVVGSKFICYRSKSVTLTENALNNEYFHSPDDICAYYPEKYALDLKESQLYVVTGKSIYTLNPCGNCYSVFSKNMEEISNVEVMRIAKENGAYNLCVGRDGQSRYISIPNLDFVIYSSGQYHWFRCGSAASLVKWLTVIQTRQGQEASPQ